MTLLRRGEEEVWRVVEMVVDVDEDLKERTTFFILFLSPPPSVSFDPRVLFIVFSFFFLFFFWRGRERKRGKEKEKKGNKRRRRRRKKKKQKEKKERRKR